MERFEGFRVVRAQLIAAAERLEATRRFWRDTPPQTSHVTAVWPDVDRAARRLIVAHGLARSPGACAVVRWLGLNLAVAARGGWPAPHGLPCSLARDLSDADRDALAAARPALEEELPRALGHAPDDRLALDGGDATTMSAWLAEQCDQAEGPARALAAA
jgi:hypothetical protein